MARDHDRHVDAGARVRAATRRGRRRARRSSPRARLRRRRGRRGAGAARATPSRRKRAVLRRERVHREAAAFGLESRHRGRGRNSTCQWYDAACSSPTGALWSTNAIGAPRRRSIRCASAPSSPRQVAPLERGHVLEPGQVAAGQQPRLERRAGGKRHEPDDVIERERDAAVLVGFLLEDVAEEAAVAVVEVAPRLDVPRPRRRASRPASRGRGVRVVERNRARGPRVLEDDDRAEAYVAPEIEHPLLIRG